MKAETKVLRDALLKAKETIHAWHGPVAWDIYDKHSPEMKIINSALEQSEKLEQWEKEESPNLTKIAKLMEDGHTHHCACRQIWGDGECECNLHESTKA